MSFSGSQAGNPLPLPASQGLVFPFLLARVGGLTVPDQFRSFDKGSS